MLPGVIPWIIFAVVVVPLVVIAFAVTRRKSSEARPATDDAETERQFAEAEAYEAEWHEADEKRFHDERLP
jgi:hypothetical protein